MSIYEISYDDFLTADVYRPALEYCRQYSSDYRKCRTAYLAKRDALLDLLTERQAGFLYDFYDIREQIHFTRCFLAVVRGWQDVEFVLAGMDNLCFSMPGDIRQAEDRLASLYSRRKTPFVRSLNLECMSASIRVQRSMENIPLSLITQNLSLLYEGQKILLPYLYLGAFASEVRRRNPSPDEQKQLGAFLRARYQSLGLSYHPSFLWDL